MARIVVFGPDGPKSYPLEDKISTLGRSKASTVHVDDKAASRKHCMIKRDDADGFTLVDMGSANGTFVNGTRTREQALVTEDRVKIGKTILVFKDDGDG